MATVTIEPRSVGESGSTLDILSSPVFVGADSVPVSWPDDFALFGAYAIVPAIESTALDDDALAVNFEIAIAPNESLDGDAPDALSVEQDAVVAVTIAADSVPEDAPEDALSLAGNVVLAMASIGESESVLAIGTPLLPTVRDPLPEETAGAVNVVPNPSLERDATGWAASAGATFARDDVSPWVGDWAGLVDVAAGGGVPEVTVRSLANLREEGQRRWVGSVAVRGDAPDVKPFLRFWYVDGSNDLGVAEPSPFVTESPWTPAAVSPLAWLNSDGLEGVAHGAATEWPDSSGNGRDATEATNRPTLQAAELNGLPVVRCNGTNQKLTIANVGIAAQPYSFAVVARDRTGVNPAGFWADAAAGAPSLSKSDPNLLIQSNTAIAIGAMASGHTSWFVACGVVSGAASFGSLNGTIGATGNAGSAFPGGVMFGSLVGSVFYPIDYAEVVFGAGAWSADTVDFVNGYLHWRFALDANLPALHPYKSAAPILVAGAVPTASDARIETGVATPNAAKVLDRVDLVLAVAQAATARTLRIDGAMIEDAAAGGATSYVDGDQGDGHGWAGAEHASASYREPMLL